MYIRREEKDWAKYQTKKKTPPPPQQTKKEKKSYIKEKTQYPYSPKKDGGKEDNP